VPTSEFDPRTHRFAVISQFGEVEVMYFANRSDAARYFNKRSEDQPQVLWLLVQVIDHAG
jgi:hypothetical protein